MPRALKEWWGKTPDTRPPPRVLLPRDVLERRFLDKCIPEPNSGCWLWIGAQKAKGYGHMWVGGGYAQATHISIFLETGRWISEFACHHCDMEECVNVNHLWEGTQLENIRDCISKDRLRSRGMAGERNGSAVLCAKDVEIIRSVHRYHGVLSDLSRRFGVSTSTIFGIRNGNTWDGS